MSEQTFEDKVVLHLETIERNITQIFQKINEVNGTLDYLREQSLDKEFKTPKPPKEPKVEDHVDTGPPTKDDLIAVLGDGVFDTDLEYVAGGLAIKTRKYLKDLWDGYNDTLKEFKYGWHSDKEAKVYQWEYEYKKASDRPKGEPKKASQDWKKMKGKGKGGTWNYTDQQPEIVDKMNEKNQYEDADYRYSLYGDVLPETGLPKFISRWPKD